MKKGIAWLLAVSGALLALTSCADTRDLSTAEQHVLGGTNEPDYQFPWLVTLSGGGCHGVLIDDLWVLSAAHCNTALEYGDTQLVSYSRTDPVTNLETVESQHVDYSSIYPHEYPLDNDIMLMHLPQPFTPSQYLQPALLPILSAAPGQDVTYAGDILGPMAQILRGQVKSTPGGVWHQTFDASSPTASLCPGDSGGGLITDVSGLNFVAGVLKEGPRAGCNAPGETFTATNVYWYLSWIYEHTGALGVDPASDLLWTSTSNWDIWSMRDGRYQFDTSGPKNTDLSVVGTGDFNGDGTSDILWKNVDGQLLIWHMREGRNVGSISLGGDPGYEVKAIADTNGDKIADIVLHNASTGDVVVWQMAAPGYRASEGTLPKVDPGWEILGAGDFNHDGKDDLIWRQSNTSPNPLAVWFLDGTSLMGQDPIYPDTVPPDYSFVGIGDLAPHPSDPRPFKDDIVWIDSAGKVQIWYFVGVNGLAGFKESTAGAVSTNWVLKQVADVNGDGTSDLVWIRNETHEVVSWLMSWDTTTEEWQYVAWDSGTAPLGFTLDAAAPFD